MTNHHRICITPYICFGKYFEIFCYFAHIISKAKLYRYINSVFKIYN